MKDDKKDLGEELVDIDEKGNPLEGKKEQKKKKVINKYTLVLAIIFFILFILCYYYFKCKKNIKNIFDETTLKGLKLKNRILLGPSSHNIEKIENIVKNDVSLVITEGCIVGDFALTNLQPEGPFRIDNDEYIPEIKKLADIVHKYNSYIILDLVHLGLISSEHYTPSGINFIDNIQPKIMTKEDILKVQNYFVQSALRAKKSGFDGVEVHGGQLSLGSLFCSKKYNTRTDEYGGSDENRARFIVEIVRKIRDAVGKDMIISAKIDAVDEENGFTENGFLTTGKALENAGLDFIEISGPNPLRNDKDPYFYKDTKKLAEILKIPVVCIGGIKTYEQADYILKNSNIEYIGIARELLKQPDLVKKWYLKKIN